MTGAAWPVNELYLRRPTLEYSQAFDLSTMNLKDQNEPALAVLSSAVHAVELLKRCPGSLHLASNGDFQAARIIASAESWAWGPLAAADLGDDSSTYSAILWAEPEADSAEWVAGQLRKRATPGASLQVIASGPLHRFLPAWKTEPMPAKGPFSPGMLLRVLPALGWKVDGVITFHGPRAIIWSLLARAAAMAGRPDWEDRCTLAMRRHYREPGWLWPLAPLALIQARAA